MRQARGEHPAGRKVGYTNRNIWGQYNVYAPIWGQMYEHTVQFADHGSRSLALDRTVSPRIEPEIAFKLRAPLPAGCTDPVEILSYVEWMARAFEIVDCHYPEWKFTAPDSVLDFGHHAALVVGDPHMIEPRDVVEFADALGTCSVTLSRDGTIVENGVGSNALGHPALALAFLADVLAQQPAADALHAGEIITTGTLTSALPVAPGEIWSTETAGLPLPPLAVSFD